MTSFVNANQLTGSPIHRTCYAGCASLVTTTATCVKTMAVYFAKFSLGFVVGHFAPNFSGPLTDTFIEKFEWLKFNRETLLKLSNYSSYLAGITQKVSISSDDKFFDPITRIKINQWLGPIAEELFYRDVIQNGLFKLPLSLLNIQPDTKTSKALRIFSTATLFAAAHSVLINWRSESSVQWTITNAFFGGIVYGLIRESRLGRLGGIGAHLGNNLFWVLLERHGYIK